MRTLRMLHHLHRLLVAEAMIGLDRRSCETLRGQDPLRAKVQDRGHGISRATGLEAGQAVREDLGQHGDHPIRQVDAGAAMAGRAVERRSRSNKVRHIGDVDHQAPMARRVTRQRNGVVKVTRCRRVDRHGRDGSQVEPAADLCFVKRLGLFTRLDEGRLLERIGDIERPNDRQRVDSRLPALAQDLDQDAFAARGRPSGSGPSRARPCLRA